jgi:hypothetical protein
MRDETFARIKAGGVAIEIFDPPFQKCPSCGAFAVCMLPPVLLSKQLDATNAVCHPSHGGCNTGFEFEAPIVPITSASRGRSG